MPNEQERTSASARVMPAVDRVAAARASVEARRARAAVKERLRSGELSPLKVLRDASRSVDARTVDDGPVPGDMHGADGADAAGVAGSASLRVADFLMTFPGIGEVGAERALERLSISPRKRLGGLGKWQRERLEAFVRERTGAGNRSGRPPLTVLAGPTAVGKGTVASYIREHYPEVNLSVSATTRKPRPGERHGEHYYFVDDEQFDRMLAAGELLEWAQVHNAYRYGTPKQPVVEAAERGELVLLEIDLQGARQVRANMPDARLVFLTPPSWEVLVERLVGRGTEDASEQARRLETAKVELQAADEFDAIIVNDVVEQAAKRLIELMRK